MFWTDTELDTVHVPLFALIPVRVSPDCSISSHKILPVESMSSSLPRSPPTQMNEVVTVTSSHHLLIFIPASLFLLVDIFVHRTVLSIKCVFRQH